MRWIVDRRAAQLLLARPDVWLRVERIATALIERGQLTPTEIDALIGQPEIGPGPQSGAVGVGGHAATA